MVCLDQLRPGHFDAWRDTGCLFPCIAFSTKCFVQQTSSPPDYFPELYVFFDSGSDIPFSLCPPKHPHTPTPTALHTPCMHFIAGGSYDVTAGLLACRIRMTNTESDGFKDVGLAESQ